MGWTVFLVALYYVGPLLGAAAGAATVGRWPTGLRAAWGVGFAVALLLLCNPYIGLLAGTLAAFITARWWGREEPLTQAGRLGAAIGALLGGVLVAGAFFLVAPSQGCMDALGVFFIGAPLLVVGVLAGAAVGEWGIGNK